MGVAIGFQQTGYLFTYYEEAWKQVPAAAEIWKANGVNFDLLSPGPGGGQDPRPALQRRRGGPGSARVPGHGGHRRRACSAADCGSFDPSQAAVGYFERAMTDFPAQADTAS